VDGDLAFALRLAELADSISLPRFRALDLRVETKADLSPVTDADRAVERAVRELVAAERPGEQVLGEEEGGAASGGHARWILDPIDGTRNFSRGIPVWATLVALEQGGELAVGVVSAPALGRRWWASRGGGAWAEDGLRLGVSAVERLDDATVSASHAKDLLALEALVWHARGFAEFWQHCLVAEGALDAAVDAPLEVWDYAAIQVVVEEAGGRVSAIDGGAPRPREQVVSSNGRVHERVLAALRDER
jgi:histidinol-phosphatase